MSRARPYPSDPDRERSLRPTDPERRTLRQNLRGLPREVWVLFIGAFVNRLGTFVLPFITLYLTSRGYSVPQAGLGLAGYGLGAIGAQAVGGLLADRIGRRNTIVLSMLGGATLTLSLVWVDGTVADRPRRDAARLLRRALPPGVERARGGPRGARGEGRRVQRLPDDDQHRLRVSAWRSEASSPASPTTCCSSATRSRRPCSP